MERQSLSGPRLLRDQVEALYREHEPAVRRFLLGVLRDEDLVREAVQQCFLKVLEHGHAASSDSIRGWIFKVAFHEALQIRRRHGASKRALRGLQERQAQPSDAPVDPGDLAADREALEAVQRAIADLPDSQREVLLMRIRQGLSFAEIAGRLDVPLGTALTRMRLALEKLRQAARKHMERTKHGSDA